MRMCVKYIAHFQGNGELLFTQCTCAETRFAQLVLEKMALGLGSLQRYPHMSRILLILQADDLSNGNDRNQCRLYELTKVYMESLRMRST